MALARKLFVLAAVLVLSFSLAQTIKIGAVASATGGAAALGEPEANTFRLLQDQLNAAGGIAGHDVEIIFLDDATDTQQAVTNVNRLIGEDGVHAVICCTITANSLAIIDTVQEAEVPTVSMAASAAIIEPVAERKWVFKTPQTDRLMIAGIVEDMQAQGLETLAFMGLDDAFGEGGLTELQALIQGSDIDLVTTERYGRNDTNVTPQTLKVVASSTRRGAHLGRRARLGAGGASLERSETMRARFTSATASATRAFWNSPATPPTACVCPSAR